MNPRPRGKIELETAKMEAAFIGAVEAGEEPQEQLDYLAFIAARKTGYRPPAGSGADKCGKGRDGINQLQIPSGWTFTKKPKSLMGLFPPKLPAYKGMLFIIGSHGFFSINASTAPEGIYYIEKHLRKKYGDKAVEWVLYSIPHTNYSDNKKIVKDNMRAFPEKDNLFLADDISAVLEKVPVLSFLDETAAKEKRAEELTQALIKLTGWEDKKSKPMNYCRE
jgi:hypothetical protein